MLLAWYLIGVQMYVHIYIPQRNSKLDKLRFAVQYGVRGVYENCSLSRQFSSGRNDFFVPLAANGVAETFFYLGHQTNAVPITR